MMYMLAIITATSAIAPMYVINIVAILSRCGFTAAIRSFFLRAVSIWLTGMNNKYAMKNA